MKKNILLILVLLLFCIPSIFPLFSPGFYPMHDDTQVARVFEMKEALSEGIFPVRWVQNLGYGYGYPIFNFYAPLAYYVGGLFNLIGFDSLVATKIMIGIGTVLSGIFMYFLAREFWGRLGGFLAALLYVYAPYHALNIYVRGAIAELWAYAFIPIVFLGLYKLYENSSKYTINNRNKLARWNIWKWISLTALSYAAIIISHNLTAFMVTPFITFFAGLLLIKSIKKRSLGAYFIPASLIIGGLLSAFYWLPVVYEMKYTNVLSVVGGGSDYKDHFICISQLWNSPWAYGGSIPGCNDGLSFKVGKLHIIAGLLAIMPLVFLRNNVKVRNAILIGFLGATVSLFLTLELSKTVWDSIHQMSFFQFPWRFLALVSFFVSFIGGALMLLLPAKLRFITAIVLSLLVIYINLEMFKPSSILDRSAEDYTNKAAIQWQTSKLSDEYMPQGFQKPKTQSEIPEDKITADPKYAKISSVTVSTQKIEAVIDTSKDVNVKVHIAYYPAWEIAIDGKITNYKNTSTGLQVLVPEGKHTLVVSYRQTLIQKIADFLSLTGVIILIAGIITQRKDNKPIAKSS